MFLSSRHINAGNLSKWIFGRYTVVFVYVVFHQVQQSMSEIVSITTTPSVELTRLRFDLLDKYQKIVRPLRNQKDVLNVEVFYDIFHVTSLDEKYQTLTVNGQLKMYWSDEFLTWNPENYSHISMVRFSPESIWWPDLLVQYNTKSFSLYEKGRSPPITVYSNGSVQWYPHVRCSVPCNADYRHYPFDSHDCSVVIIPATYNLSGVAVLPRRGVSEVVNVGTEWSVSDVTQEGENGTVYRKGFQHQRVRIRIFLERVSRMYRYICVIPTLASMLGLLFGFWLLPTETPRYVIGCSNIVVLSMLLQHMVLTIPAGKVVPLIAQYSATCLCMSSVFILVSVITKLVRDCGGKAPDVLLRLAHLAVGRRLCIFTFSHRSPADDGEENRRVLGAAAAARDRADVGPTPEEEEELQRRRDWHTVSVLVDRVCFWCFSFVFVVLLGVLAAI